MHDVCCKIEILEVLLERWITFMHKELIWIHDVYYEEADMDT